MEWPRIPFPGWPDGDAGGASDELAESAARGRELASPPRFRDTRPRRNRRRAEAGNHRHRRAIHHHRPQHVRRRLRPDGKLGPLRIRPGRHARLGPSRQTPLHPERTNRPRQSQPPLLGDTTFDIYLNDVAYWRNVPAAVWTYKLGGYQILKKWLSYREYKVLGRALKLDEVQHFTNTARRIARILGVTR